MSSVNGTPSRVPACAHVRICPCPMIDEVRATAPAGASSRTAVAAVAFAAP
jgi:hypothetical protein